MPVQRFRSIEEMNAAPVRRRPDDGFERFVRHCARYRPFARRPRPRGVFRFRSLEEAQRARRSGRRGPRVAVGADSEESEAQRARRSGRRGPGRAS